MLTTIDAKRGKTVGGSGRSSPGRDSTEDIIKAENKAYGTNAWGGIEVTTQVDVRESHSPTDLYSNGVRHQHPEARNIV